MKTTIIIGAVGALLTGIAIGIQSTITSRLGSIIGDIKISLLTNFLGGVIAGLIVLFLFLRDGPGSWKIAGNVFGFICLSGLLGIAIVTGISFSLQRAGIAAGLATVILGQLALSIIVDAHGIGGVETIPLSFQRIMGLLVIGIGVLLILPRG